MKNKRFSDRMAPAAAALSLVACYGTLAAIGLLGAIGAAMITFTLLVAYERIIELVGFAFRGIGTFLDRRAPHSVRGPVK